MCIRVVVFANQYTRRFQPFVERIATDILPARHETLVLFTTQQGCQVIVQPASAVMTGIHNHRFFVTATSQQFGVDFAETFTVHAFNVYISDLAAGQFIHFLAAVFYPTFVQQVRLLAIRDRFHLLFETFFCCRVVDGQQYFLSGFTAQ